MNNVNPRKVAKVVIPLIIWILFMVYFLRQFKSCDGYHESYTKKKMLSGVITKKYKDKWNHNDRKVELSDGKSFTLLSGLLGLWEAIEIGDSISKDSGSLEFQVFKSDTTMVFYPDC